MQTEAQRLNMTTMPDGQPALTKSHRNSAVYGVIAGLVVLAAWLAYQFAATPSKPNITTAGAVEVVSYISNDRGLASLPQVEQEQFLKQWQERIASNEAYRKDLESSIDNLNESDRKAFATAMFRQTKRAFIDDAKRYVALAESEKYKFLNDRLSAYAAQGALLKNITLNSGFRADLGSRQDDWQQWIMENTTADERAIAEPYVEGLKHVREQSKKKAPPATQALPTKP